jgi:hypothetical protein
MVVGGGPTRVVVAPAAGPVGAGAVGIGATVVLVVVAAGSAEVVVVAEASRSAESSLHDARTSVLTNSNAPTDRIGVMR